MRPLPSIGTNRTNERASSRPGASSRSAIRPEPSSNSNRTRSTRPDTTPVYAVTGPRPKLVPAIRRSVCPGSSGTLEQNRTPPSSPVSPMNSSPQGPPSRVKAVTLHSVPSTRPDDTTVLSRSSPLSRSTYGSFTPPTSTVGHSPGDRSAKGAGVTYVTPGSVGDGIATVASPAGRVAEPADRYRTSPAAPATSATTTAIAVAIANARRRPTWDAVPGGIGRDVGDGACRSIESRSMVSSSFTCPPPRSALAASPSRATRARSPRDQNSPSRRPPAPRTGPRRSAGPRRRADGAGAPVARATGGRGPRRVKTPGRPRVAPAIPGTGARSQHAARVRGTG